MVGKGGHWPKPGCFILRHMLTHPLRLEYGRGSDGKSRQELLCGCSRCEGVHGTGIGVGREGRLTKLLGIGNVALLPTGTRKRGTCGRISSLEKGGLVLIPLQLLGGTVLGQYLSVSSMKGRRWVRATCPQENGYISQQDDEGKSVGGTRTRHVSTGFLAVGLEGP